MKKCLTVAVILLAASLPSFGSHAQPSPYSQFRAKHLRPTAPNRVRKSAHDGPPLPLTHAQKMAVAAQHLRPTHYGQNNTATTSVGLISAPLISIGGEDDDETSPALGDFNGDGKKDVVKIVTNQVQSSTVYQLSVMLSNGNGTFQTAVLTNLTADNEDPIFVGDLNGDGKDDVLQVHPELTPSTVDVYLSNGDGTFAASTNVQLSAFTLNGGVLTDVNGDGKLDILLVDSENPGIVTYLLGNGDGTFQAGVPMATLAGVAPNNLFFADFNGDGKVDFAGQSNGGQLSVYLAASGAFAAPVALTTSDGNYNECNNVTGDLTGDGKPEIVSLNCSYNTLTVYVNNGDGSFQAGVYYQNAGDEEIDPYAAAIADFNGDGKNDVIVTGDESGQVTAFLGNGDGTITPLTVGFGIGGFAWENPLVADFNGDGILDIIESNDTFTFSYLEGNGDGTFDSALSYYAATRGESYNSTYAIASGDFNGDGIPDVVLGQDDGDGSRPGVLVMLSNADGSLQPGVSVGTSSSTLAYVVVGDFNGDQKLDIAATDYLNGNIQVFMGNGDGTFTAGQTFATDTVSNPWPENLVLGDFNHDGKLDIAVANVESSTVAVLLGNGDGTFSVPTSYSIENGVYGLAAADVNGDGYLDLATTTDGSGNNVALLLGNNDNSGTFQSETDLATGAGQAESIAFGDLNGDGKVDMAVTMANGSTFNGEISVALGNGDGTFQAPVAYSSTTFGGSSAYPYPATIVTTDFDGDGKLDLVYTNYEYGTVAIMYGKGDGTFYNPIDFAASGYDWAFTIADVNNDGAADVVVSNYYAGGATVLLNNSGSKTGANFTITAAQNSQTVTAGSSATYDLMMTGKNGYSGTVTFSCTGLPTGAACNFSPASIMANGNASIATTLTITTTAATSASQIAPFTPNSMSIPPMFLGSILSLGLFGIMLAGSKRQRARFVPVFAMLILMSLLVGCSGVSSHGTTTSGTPAGTYTVGVQGSGAHNVSHTTNVQLVVQ
jgi:hypothetical protein